ncbi:hypothetical protein AB5I41_11625 [Sphingomonas sp. MMS24-JH45]
MTAIEPAALRGVKVAETVGGCAAGAGSGADTILNPVRRRVTLDAIRGKIDEPSCAAAGVRAARAGRRPENRARAVARPGDRGTAIDADAARPRRLLRLRLTRATALRTTLERKQGPATVASFRRYDDIVAMLSAVMGDAACSGEVAPDEPRRRPRARVRRGRRTPFRRCRCRAPSTTA